MPLTRRNLLRAASALPLALRASAQDPAPRPNILFILADDLGWGDLSCYGNTQFETPHLDRLAAQGALFTQCYVNGPVCSPTRSSFLTGRFPGRNRIHGHLATEELNARRAMPNFLDPAVPNVARLLKQAGYRTAHFGKWHLGRFAGAPLPGAYGFDEHKSVSSNDERFEEMADGFRARSTRWMVDEGLDFIRSTPRPQPFYLQLWTLVPHAPLAPTPEQLAPMARFQPGPHVPWPGARQIYGASVRDLDEQIGRLLRRLDEDGRAGNTLVIFSSDNGPEDIHIQNASHAAFGSPGPFRGRKRSLYEGGVRVPGILRWPGRIAAGRVDTRSVVSGVDLLPTAARLAGAPAPPDLDGEDVSDILLGSARPRRTPLLWEWRFRVFGYNVNRSPVLAIRDGGWKLLLNPDRSRVELYRIVDDPGEMNNVAAAFPAIVERLAAQALAWQKTLPPGPADADAGRNDWRWPRESR